MTNEPAECDDHGPRTLVHLQRNMTERQHDVVIVGGGPAGVNAALECTDIKLDVVLLEAGAALGGQLVEITHPVRNVATGRYADGRALQAGLQTAAAGARRSVRLRHPVSRPAWRRGGSRRAVSTLRGQGGAHREWHHSRTPPARPMGRSEETSPTRGNDPDRFAGRPVVVVGGGDSATLDALSLAPLASLGDARPPIRRSDGEA